MLANFSDCCKTCLGITEVVIPSTLNPLSTLTGDDITILGLSAVVAAGIVHADCVAVTFVWLEGRLQGPEGAEDSTTRVTVKRPPMLNLLGRTEACLGSELKSPDDMLLPVGVAGAELQSPAAWQEVTGDWTGLLEVSCTLITRNLFLSGLGTGLGDGLAQGLGEGLGRGLGSGLVYFGFSSSRIGPSIFSAMVVFVEVSQVRDIFLIHVAKPSLGEWLLEVSWLLSLACTSVALI